MATANINYDSFGNMLPTDNLNGNPAYSIDAATNRLLNGSDIGYNADGSVSAANGHTFDYTAEGYLSGIDQHSTGSYAYNAVGQRTTAVRSDSDWNEYVYLNGQVMADTDNTGKWTDLIYANGEKIARLEGSPSPATHYYLDDQLGTAQIELDATGAPTWQGWFTPFGQEIINGWASNYIGNQPADGTTMRYKFTGKERDTESGLDYFGARYYASSMGRWMSPDWSSSPNGVPYADLSDPQSLNLYEYVGNNPLSRADADGHCYPFCPWVSWAVAGIATEGAGPFARNVGIGVLKGLGQAAYSTVAIGASGGNPGLATAYMMNMPSALRASNQTQAVAAFTTSVVAPVVLGAFGGAISVTAAAPALLETESVSTTSLLTGLANDAVANVGPGSGAVYGTAVHSEFSGLVEATGNANLSTEVSYQGGQVVPYGTAGSIRADVVEGPVNAPTGIYDLKTGNASLSSSRVSQIQSQVPGGSNVPVTQIKPQP